MTAGASSLASTNVQRVQVLLPLAVDRTFVYHVPEPLRASMRTGLSVRVPFRQRVLAGIVVDLDGAAPPGRLRSIESVPDPDLYLPEETLAFTRWLATYYGASWGEVARAALPGYVGRRARSATPPGELAASLVPEVERAVDGPQPHELSVEQSGAVARLEAALDARAFHVALLHGVTASGKTEVYLRAAARACREDGQALVLVPEIGISVQLLEAFRARFDDRVAVFHSDLPDSQRRAAWKAVQGGTCRVLVGARSALFAPFRALRLIVVDEEHEAAYKQAEQPRYHARDAAVMRARMNDALVVLGSATPSLESAYNAAQGRYERLTMERRVDDGALPEVRVVDLRVLREAARAQREAERGERRRAGARKFAERLLAGPPAAGTGTDAPAADVAAAPSVPERPEPEYLSAELLEALSGTVAREQQAILLVGRRGHSTFVQCVECGQVAVCDECEVSLVYHSEGRALRCHHCGFRTAAPERCACSSETFWYGGVGTQRVEAELRRRLAEARVLRMDLDSTRKTGAHGRIVRAFAAGDADILLGTQMVAKGLHFPRVSLVGVVSADLQLNLPDFRAGERTFQLLTQVAGRAGRGDIAGRVLIQTYTPDHPAIQAAVDHDYARFYEHTIAERGELGYPPTGAMARFLIDGPREEDVQSVAERLQRAASGRSARLIGPSPLPIARLRQRHRWHLTLLGDRRGPLQALAAGVLERVRAGKLPPRLRLFLDMDPQHLL